MKIDISEENGVKTVTLEGRLDVSSTYDFREITDSIVDSDTRGVVIDLSRTEMISSVGIREFILLKKKTDTNNIEFRLVNMSSKLTDIFATMGLNELFGLEGDS